MDKRLEQLCQMMKFITGISMEESKRIILLTPTGRSVQDKEMTVMYEQQTENLYSIGVDLSKIAFYKKLAELFTVEKICDAMKKVILRDTKQIVREEKCEHDKKISLLDKQRAFLLQQQRRKAECL